MNEWKIIGHNYTKELLKRYLEQGSIPHAFLFSGPEGVGKRSLALEFAGKLLHVDRLDRHPDVHIIDAKEEGFDIDRARRFMSTLQVKPLLGGYTLGIIDNADALNIQTANALLKTLEEPNPGTILFLISSSGGMLPTIVSRCQVFNFTRLGPREFAEFVAMQNVPLPDGLVELCAGAPGKLKSFLNDARYAERVREVVNTFSGMSSTPTPLRLAKVPELAELEDGILTDGLLGYVNFVRTGLSARPQSYRGLQALLTALDHLNMHLNKKMVLERLCFEL